MISGGTVDMDVIEVLNISDKFPPDDALPKRERNSSAVTFRLFTLPDR